MLKRMISLLLCVVMVISMIPAQVFATDDMEEEILDQILETEPVEEKTEPVEDEVDPLEEDLTEDETEPVEEENEPTEELEQIEQEPMLSDDSIIASGTCGDNLTWELDKGGKLTISGTGEMSYYTSTEQVPWYNYAYFISEISLPEGLGSIAGYSFANCHSVKSITIPESVYIIYGNAFLYTGITSLTIPKNVASIDIMCFQSCYDLKEITVDPENEYYCSVDGIMFSKDLSTLHYYPCGMSGETFTVPDNITTIGDFAFFSCTNLKNIELPDGLSEIGFAAFQGADFKTITIPASIDYIDGYAFFSCDELTDVYFTGTEEQWNTLVENRLGPDNNSLLNATIHCSGDAAPTEPEETESTEPEDDTIRGTCGENLNWALKDGVLTISGTGDMSFDIAYEAPWQVYAGRITEIVLETGVTSVAEGAFAVCRMESITIPEGVLSIGNNAFDSCKNLTSIILPESLTSIGFNAFSYTPLTGVTIPENVSNIGGGAFQYCTQLTDISVDEENQHYYSVDGVLFSVDRNSLHTYPAGKSGEVYCVPGDIRSIESGAFTGCSNLTRIEVPEDIEYMEWLIGVDNLTGIVLPSSLSYIAFQMFEYCDNLTDIYYTGTEEQWDKLLQATNSTENPSLFDGSITVHCNWTGSLTPRSAIDYWTFENHYDTFGAPKEGYYITQDDYNQLIRNLPEGERKQVTIKEVYNEAEARAESYRRYDIPDREYEALWGEQLPLLEWNGSCYGMSVWTCLVNNGVLNATDIDGVTQNLSDYAFTQDVESAINFYHSQQWLFPRICAESIWLTESNQKQQLQNLENMGKAANTGGNIFLITFNFYEWKEDKNGKSYMANMGHAVVGYGWEEIAPRTITINGYSNTYDKRILIYDCSDPNEEYDNHIYYNDEGICCIPAWNFSSTDQFITESKTDLSNNGSLQFATSDAQFLNLVDYNTGEVVLKSEVDYSSIYAGIGQTYTLEYENQSYEVSASRVSGGSTEMTPRLWFMTNVAADRSVGDVSAMAILPQGIHNCTISTNNAMSFQFSTPDSLSNVHSDQPGQIQFRQDGTVSLKTQEPAEYTITMHLDADNKAIPWRNVRLQGSGTSEFSAECTENGVVISADNMEKIAVAVGEGSDHHASVLSANEPVLLSEKDGEPVFLTDSNEDGIFDEELDTMVENRVIINEAELGSQPSVWIDGREYTVKTDGDVAYVDLPNADAKTMVTYTYQNADDADVHTHIPTGMKVWTLSNTDGFYTATRVEELDDMLGYVGCSIRVKGNQGIRMITSIDQTDKDALTAAGLAGYTLEEYGTAIAWASQIGTTKPLTLGKSYVSSNYAYKKNVADPIFNSDGDVMQYTNVLVGFTLDQCSDDIAMRPYMILKDADGNEITLYGGIVKRSIGYIALRNRKTFTENTDPYDYVWEIIHAVYGDTYDADWKPT